MIKNTFRTFTASALVLKQAAEAATKARLQDQTCSSVTIEINADHAAISFMALPAWTAFAVEMGLKTLLISTGVDQAPRGHDLARLFSKLPPDIQREIESKTLEVTGDAQDMDFSTLLEKNKLAFEQWRYFHEGKSTQSNIGFLQSLMLAVHNSAVLEKANV